MTPKIQKGWRKLKTMEKVRAGDKTWVEGLNKWGHIVSPDIFTYCVFPGEAIIRKERAR